MHRVCQLLADGDVATMAEAAKLCGISPAKVCLFATAPEFRELYTRAREAQAEQVAARAVRRAQASTPATVASDRLAVDTDKWFAAKLWPRKFADVETLVPIDLDTLSDDQLAQVARGVPPSKLR